MTSTKQRPRANDTSRFSPSAAAAAGLAFAATVAVAAPASGNERAFTYVYGSDVLVPGTWELEPWTTARIGRESFYLRLDHRVEAEVGIAPGAQLAFYLNWSEWWDVAGGGAPSAHGAFRGVSVESKLKFLDAVADPVGLGLYFEPGIGPTSAELEAKLLVDKRVGDAYFAGNAVVEWEPEWGQKNGVTRHLFIAEGDAGVTYFFVPGFSAGLELRGLTRFRADTGWEHSAIFVGPVLSVADDPVWATLTVMPQIFGLRAGLEDHLVLDLEERVQARLLMGFHL